MFADYHVALLDKPQQSSVVLHTVNCEKVSWYIIFSPGPSKYAKVVESHQLIKPLIEITLLSFFFFKYFEVLFLKWNSNDASP